MDRYDEEVERLTEHPERIKGSWTAGMPLFAFCAPNGKSSSGRPCDRRKCGCPSMVRSESIFGSVAWTPELTTAIRADERIPRLANEIRPEHLPVFAEWQRKIDDALDRTPPPLLAPHPSNNS